MNAERTPQVGEVWTYKTDPKVTFRIIAVDGDGVFGWHTNRIGETLPDVWSTVSGFCANYDPPKPPLPEPPEIQAVADSLAERLSHLLVALADCDVVVSKDADGNATAEFPRYAVYPIDRRALAAAITAARIAVDAYNEESEP